MLPYWLLFTLTSLFAVRDLSLPAAHRRYAPHLILIAFLAVAIVGLRYEVGGDWTTYQNYFDFAAYDSFSGALDKKDPGYQLINWIGAQSDFGIWTVNLACAAIFVAGLLRFVRTLPSPTLAFAVAVPYLIIVVAMGYTRQAAAIGFVMAAIAYLRNAHWHRLALCVVLAVTLHKTAVILLPIIAISRARNRTATLAVLGVLGILLYFLFLEQAMDALMSSYIESDYDSNGVYVRVAMNVIPAVLFLLFGRRFPLLDENEYLLWRNMSWAALACIPGLVILPSTVVIDRLALYLIPLQLFVLSWIPLVLGRNWRDNKMVFFSVLAYSAAVQFVWLNYAGHKEAWVPYKFYPTATLTA